MGLTAVCLKQGLCDAQMRGHSEVTHTAGATQVSPSSLFQRVYNRLKAPYVLPKLQESLFALSAANTVTVLSVDLVRPCG